MHSSIADRRKNAPAQQSGSATRVIPAQPIRKLEPNLPVIVEHVLSRILQRVKQAETQTALILVSGEYLEETQKD